MSIYGIPLTGSAVSINGQSDGANIYLINAPFDLEFVKAYIYCRTALVKGDTVAGAFAAKAGTTDVGTVHTIDSTEVLGQWIEFTFPTQDVAKGTQFGVYLKTAPTGTGGTGTVEGVLFIRPKVTDDDAGGLLGRT